MKLHSITFRQAVLIISLTALAMISIWWVLWMIAASQYRSVINGWFESGRASGYQISYDESRLFGFPHHVVLRFTNVQWRNTDNIIFHADDIDIASIPWQWQKFNTKFKHHVEITAPVDTLGHALIFGGEDGRAHIELTKDGTWRLSDVSLTQAKFGQSPNYLLTAGLLHVSAERPEEQPQSHKEAGLTLSGEAKDVVLPDAIPSPFGNQMKNLAIDMRVMGAMPDFRKRESTDAWNKESGVVEFDKLHMDWGPLQMTSRGTMGLDDDLQPEGAFAASLNNHESVLQALMEHNFIAKSQENMMSSALSLFAKPSQTEAAPGIELPITVQLGGLFMGPVRIFTFPEIEWPENVPSVLPMPAAEATSPPSP